MLHITFCFIPFSSPNISIGSQHVLGGWMQHLKIKGRKEEGEILLLVTQQHEGKS